jgi:hypothetical protein
MGGGSEARLAGPWQASKQVSKNTPSNLGLWQVHFILLAWTGFTSHCIVLASSSDNGAVWRSAW